MPQIQILGRERMEQKNNLANQAIERQKIIQDTWYKAQMLRYYADELKYKVQASQDEVSKAEITQKYNDAKLGADVMNNAYKIAEKQGGKAAQDYLMGVQQQSPQLFSGIMSSGFGEKLSKLQPSGSERLAGSAAELVQRQLGERGQGGAGQQMLGQMPGGAQPTNEGRAGAVGGAVIPKITAGGVDVEFPEVREQIERRMVRARGEETRNVEMTPIRNAVNYYTDTFDKAVEEMGGLSSTAASSMARGTASSVWANIGNRPNTLALQQMSKSVALQLGSYLNRGRPTEQDAEAAAKMLVKLTLTKGANEVLRHFLKIVTSGNDMYVGRDRKGETHKISPAADKIYDMLKTGKVPEEKFIITEIK